MSNDALFSAIERSDLPAAQAALDAGAAPNALNAKGRTALIEACSLRSVAIVRLLLARGADVELASFARTPLSFACQLGGYREERHKLEPAALAVIDALLEAKADVNASKANGDYPPLVAALSWGTIGLARRLLQERPNVTQAMVHLAVSSGAYELVQPMMVRAGGVDRTALLRHLCEHGDRNELLASIARTLCKLKANPNQANADGVTATHFAAYWTDVPMLLALIEAGADLNAQTSSRWYINDSDVAAGTTARMLLDRRIEFASEDWAKGDVSSRDDWEKLAAALGTTVEQWLVDAAERRAQTPAKKPRKTKKAK